jgi:glycosyltransferase involved in cell wall biosynthesis
VIIPIDADLQNDPADIPRLLAKLKEGYDVVSGWRRNRRDPFFSRRLPSILANRLISFVTGVKLNDYGCTLKAYKREVIKDIRLYGEMHRFLPALAVNLGARIAEIEVSHQKRKYGRSKYGIGRIFKVILDLFTVKFMGAYFTKPIYIFGGMGILLNLFAVGIATFVVIRRYFFSGEWISPMILLSLLCVILGFQFISLGLLAEIMVRTYYAAQQTLPYVVEERIE